jgi:hypothetical protein
VAVNSNLAAFDGTTGKLIKDSGYDATDFATSGHTHASSGHTIEDEGTSLTTRGKLNFVGSGVTVTDDLGDDASVVTIPGASGDVVGPASAVDSNFAAFDTTTGKLIKDSGKNNSSYDVAGAAAAALVSALAADHAALLPDGSIPFTGDIRGKDFISTRSSTITYTGAYITSIAKTGGRTVTFTLNGSNQITSFTDGTNTWTITYNGSNKITLITVT